MTDYFPSEVPYGDDQSAASNPMSTVVPHSREAEEAVVGAVLINSEAYYDVAQFLAADDFYIHRNQWIWDAFVRLHEQRIPVDLLTLSEEANDRLSIFKDFIDRLDIDDPDKDKPDKDKPDDSPAP